MAIRLEKGQRINLEKSNGAKLTQFCVGCNWGAIEEYKTVSCGFLGLSSKQKKVEIDVDVDLSCVMTDANGKLVDTLYSPLYNPQFFQAAGLPVGKDWSADNSMYHTPDDTEGDKGGDDGLDNEIVTVDLTKVNPRIEQIFFFLNIYRPKNIDFQRIPYVAIRMFEGTPNKVNSVFAQYDVAKESQFSGKDALIMGKLYRRNGDWKFAAIGDAFEDGNDLRQTIKRILNSYTK
jgi:tellurium resistance protein TerZ